MIKEKAIVLLKKIAFSVSAALCLFSCENFQDDAGAFFDSYANVATVKAVTYSRKLEQSNGSYMLDSSADFTITYVIDNPGDFPLSASAWTNGTSIYKSDALKIQSNTLITLSYPASYLENMDGGRFKLPTNLTLMACTPNGKLVPQSMYTGLSILCNSPPPAINNAMGQMQNDPASSINERLVVCVQLPLLKGALDWKSFVVTDKRTETVHSYDFAEIDGSRTNVIQNGTESNGWTIYNSANPPSMMGPTYSGGPTFSWMMGEGAVYYIVTDVNNLSSMEPFQIALTLKDDNGLTNEIEIPSHAVQLAPPTCNINVASVENTFGQAYVEFIIRAPANCADATLHYAIADSSGNPVADTSGSATEHVGDATFWLYPKTDGSAETYTISQAYATKTGWGDSNDAAATFGSGGTVTVTGVQLEEPTADIADGASIPQETKLTLESPQGGDIWWITSDAGASGDDPSPVEIIIDAAGSYIVQAYAHKAYYQNSTIAKWTYNVFMSKVYIKSDGNDFGGTGTIGQPFQSFTRAQTAFATSGDPTNPANKIYVLDDMPSMNGLTSIDAGYYNVIGCNDQIVGAPVSLGVVGGATIFSVNGGTLTLRSISITGQNNASSGAVDFIAGTFILKDKVTITGNAVSSGGAAKNVNIASGQKITIDAGGLDGTRVGVTTADVPTSGHPVTLTQGYAAACGTTLPSTYFVSDNASYSAYFNTAGDEAAIVTGGGGIDYGTTYVVTFAADHSGSVYTIKATATPTSSGGSPTDITDDITAWSMKLFDHNADTGTSSATNTMDLSAFGEGTYIMKISAVYGGKLYSGEVEITISEPMPAGLVLIPHGSFKRAESSSNPAYTVTLTKDFYICDHEVTQKEWFDVMGVKQEDMYATDKGWGDNYPVYYVNWYAAIAYCNKRSVADGLTPCYTVSGVSDSDWATLAFASIPTSYDSDWNAATCNWTATGYRLPTEAEWEYAALGSYKDNSHWTGYIDSNHPSANVFAGYDETNALGDYAWYSGNASSKTHEAKKKTENSYSLYDMSGNVSEWCWDWRGNYDSVNVTDPTGAPSGSGRVYRGGNWSSSAGICSVADRGDYNPYSRYNYIGLRVVRNAP